MSVSPQQQWRESLSLSRRELAELTGYSTTTIYLFERGLDTNHQPHNPEALKRYKAACLAVTVLKHCKQPSLATWEWTT